jgi:hypothetical protein
VGVQPLLVRAAGFGPWVGSCEIGAQTTAAARVVLQPDVTCSGRVSSGGQPVDGAKVSCEGPSDFLSIATYTGADGTFELRGLPAGDVGLNASKDGVGKATARIRGEPGAPVRCELALSNGLVLRGRVLDAAGTPVPLVHLHCHAEGTGERWKSFAHSDGNGSFLVAQCPPGRTLSLVATERDHVPWQRRAIDPSAGGLEIRLAKDTTPRARITGRLLRPDGRGALGTSIGGWRLSPYATVSGVVDKPDGAFVLEVPAGTWTMHTVLDGHPAIRREAIELQAGALHDVGVLQFGRGGTLVVHDDAAAKFDHLVFDAHEQFACGFTVARPRRSDLLAPGDYLLLARAKDSAAQRIPFAITAERETVLTVKPVPGTRRRIEFVPAAGAEVDAVAYDVRCAGALAMINSLEANAANELAQDVCLAPGDYELTTRRPEPKVTVRFTIADGANDPLRVQLR